MKYDMENVMVIESPTPNAIKDRYDAVIVGARPAGAATGMLLARAGLDVLIIDRASRGSDTLSSHALMRGAVDALDRWGLLPAVIAAGTPTISRTQFRYMNSGVSSGMSFDIEPLYAPRRTVLDPIVADAAAEAGATVCHQTAAAALLRDSTGRVTGIVVDDASDTGAGRRTVSADIVIGADGLRSWVARQVEAPVTRAGTACASWMMTYVKDAALPDNSYVWAANESLLGGIIPTNRRQHILFAGMPRDRFTGSVRGRAEAGYLELMAELGEDLHHAAVSAQRIGPLRSFPGHVAQFRKPVGPGWALVGDAGYFKDPAAAHGIADAFRDAELLTEALLDGDLARYERQRDDLSTGLFNVLEKLAGFDWTLDELPSLHQRLSKTMRDELTEFQSRPQPVRSRLAVAA